MFRNKILIRAASPSSSSPFLLVPLSLPSEDSSISLIDLEILCCKLSRIHRLACFLHSDDIFVIYQRSQLESASRVVEEIVRSISSIDVGVEEEVMSASLIAKAVECGLRSTMLDNCWSSVGENSFVESTFACSEEKKHLCAINVRVQAETNNGFVFIVCPDVLWFKRHKISDLASSSMLEKFESGNIAILEAYVLSRSCTVLPYLYEGHVIGLSKLLPASESLNRVEELSVVKHGLALPSNYFINIQFRNRSDINRQWYPAAFVLHDSGLMPSPRTIRASKALHALEFFVTLLGGWDFFSQGPLKVKEVSSLGSSALLPVWTRATSSLKDVAAGDSFSCAEEFIRGKNSISSHLQLSLDFHTPKPALGCISTTGQKHVNVLAATTLSSKGFVDISVHGADIIKTSSVEQKIQAEFVHVNERNVIEKKHRSAVDFANDKTTVKSALLSESRVAKKDTSAEDPVIKVTTGESLSINKRSVDKSNVAGKKLVSVEDCISGVTTAESDIASESSVTEKKHTTSENCTNKHSAPMQKVEDNVQFSSQVSQKKEEIEAFLHKQNFGVSKKAPPQEILTKKTLNNEKKSKEAATGSCKKLKTKHSVDTSHIIAKVVDHHRRGTLQSLTVPDLKGFLTTKKAKVGGKKEELIQRVTTLLA